MADLLEGWDGDVEPLGNLGPPAGAAVEVFRVHRIEAYETKFLPPKKLEVLGAHLPNSKL